MIIERITSIVFFLIVLSLGVVLAYGLFHIFAFLALLFLILYIISRIPGVKRWMLNKVQSHAYKNFSDLERSTYYERPDGGIEKDITRESRKIEES